MPTEMNRDELRRFAIAGAEARLLAIAEEAAAIYRVFPELRDRTGNGAIPDAVGGAGAAHGTKAGRRPMSAAQRKAVGERMKKYWAARRGEQKASQAAEGDGSQQPAQRKTTSAPGQRKVAREPRRARKTSSGRRPRPRRLSAAARKRISEAQKARWARQRAGKNAA
jgi:hypothetical protein